MALNVKFETKKAVRDYVLQHRPDAFPLTGLFKNLSQILDHQSGRWGAFKAMADEPPLEGMLPQRIQWFFPTIQADQMQFSQSQKWVRSTLGVQEPVGGAVVSPKDLDGFLIPGRAFSQKGQRIGRGRGHFDRALQGISGLKVGVCFEYQFFNELPVEDHDISMDVVVTDKEIYWLKR